MHFTKSKHQIDQPNGLLFTQQCQVQSSDIKLLYFNSNQLPCTPITEVLFNKISHILLSNHYYHITTITISVYRSPNILKYPVLASPLTQLFTMRVFHDK